MDPFGLERFVDAQDRPPSGCAGFERALSEISRGAKVSHWIWYVFPQISMGRGAMAAEFAIKSAGEARAFLDHPILAPRYERITRAAHASIIRVGDLRPVMGSDIDCRKLISSLSLFAGVFSGPGESTASIVAAELLEVLEGLGYSKCAKTEEWLRKG